VCKRRKDETIDEVGSMNRDKRREQILDIVKREFIGPDPVDYENMKQDNGEEILSADPPVLRYCAGILYPQDSLPDTPAEEEDLVESGELDIHEEDTLQETEPLQTGATELLEEFEELINLSNSFRQSAISLTASVRNGDTITATVSAGIYEMAKSFGDSGKAYNKYMRKPLLWNNDNKPLTLPILDNRLARIPIICNDFKTNLYFGITYRYQDIKNNCTVYTFTLENSTKIGDAAIRDQDCFFQVQFSIHSEAGFHYLQDDIRINVSDEDYLSNQLLYRETKNYAIGHGCSAEWVVKNGKVVTLRSEIFPTYEMKPIVPANLEGVSLDMFSMLNPDNYDDIIEGVYKLCHLYDAWIDQLEEKVKDLDKIYRETAQRHITECRKCLNRMNDGVSLLRSNKMVLQAFCYMNQAMLLQQLHYNLPLQDWEDDGLGGIRLIERYSNMPNLSDKSTWYESDKRIYGQWRPFQLAFILINLKSMLDRSCDERNLVDLIWFPTGGGKTEAYLGLSAFTIFIRRLMDNTDEGTAVIMRYTLRLLTTQQYERAAAMVCACEIIRKEAESVLGVNRITIGLWVGGSTTPNNMQDAVKKYERMYKGADDDNPFIMLKCPWCGAKMGLVKIKNNVNRIPGYSKKVSGRKREIIFKCDNNACIFSNLEFPLPLLVVDEAIYNSPPTLLLGTVDKFAMLPFRPEARSLFGLRESGRVTPPDLIIQDELHLISGPLGSMVGHYEMLVTELCTNYSDNKVEKPKVIASTATISHAKQQCHALYSRDKNEVIQFPPSGIDAGDSFFAVEDETSPGRKYVGIFAPGSTSHAMTLIRLYATLLYAARAIIVSDEALRDPYWTNLGYFNSLRELGQTATWISADIDEYLHTIYKRRYEDKIEGYKENRRYIWRSEELTSRMRSDKIPASLQNLSLKYPASGEKRPIDICLATNMISVGVDVPRLGLMTVAGQPKTTTEYIQATSRVGRNADAPGLIFNVFNPGRPRDRSHYEHFVSYHSKIYCNVEPTSVTPFASPLRERALHAILIGFVRLLRTSLTYDDPKIIPTESEILRIQSLIEKWVEKVDYDERDGTMEDLAMILQKWRIEMPQKYQDFIAGEAVPLMYPSGSMPNTTWEGRGFPTPTSMRNVDASCEAYVLKNAYISEDMD
jgi:hypothetical protein